MLAALLASHTTSVQARAEEEGADEIEEARRRDEKRRREAEGN
jgi:hypothetical protein